MSQAQVPQLGLDMALQQPGVERRRPGLEIRAVPEPAPGVVTEEAPPALLTLPCATHHIGPLGRQPRLRVSLTREGHGANIRDLSGPRTTNGSSPRAASRSFRTEGNASPSP